MCPMLTHGLLFIHDVIHVQASRSSHSVKRIVKVCTKRIATSSPHLGLLPTGFDWLTIPEQPRERCLILGYYFEPFEGIPKGFQIDHELHVEVLTYSHIM